MIMKRLNWVLFYALILLALGISACSGGVAETAVAQTDETGTIVKLTPTAYPTPYSDMPRPDTCHVTQPQTPRLVPPEPYPETDPSGGFWYGTNELWTDLQPDGRWYSLPKSEAGYGNKLAFWREGYSQTKEPEPEITLSARQLDGDAIVEPVVYGTNAYHPDYGQFMMTGIELPTLGCWEITAEYRDATLSFVVWVTP
jgi:hypothetical protein